MKFLVFVILLFTVHNDFNKIAEINRLKKEARQDYLDKNYKEAARKYTILVDSLGQDGDELLMNLAHCYFNLQDTTNAINHYKQLTRSDNKSYQSVAWQQMGILDAESHHFADAEEDFKNALRANPRNDEARYNYELLKKKLRDQEQKNKQNNQQKQNKENQKQDKQQQNKQQNDQQKQQQQDQQKQQDQKSQEQKNNQQNQDQQQKKEQSQQQKGDQDKKKDEQQNQQEAKQQNDQQKDNKENSQQMSKEKFDENKISQEKARMILDAMKNTEEQYLQQLKRKSSKKPDSGKPDW